MRTIHTMPQGSPEWFAARLGVPTASRFECIVAVRQKGGTGELAARRDYRYELALELLTGLSMTGGFTSEDMENGTEREPLARNAYAIATGNLVEQIGFVRETEPNCGGSPDGLIGTDGGLEIKCPKASTHASYLFSPDVPKKYVAQCQGNMMLNERDWWDWCSFHPDYPQHLRLAVRRIWRNEQYVSGLKLAIQIFNDEVQAEALALRNHVEVLP